MCTGSSGELLSIYSIYAERVSEGGSEIKMNERHCVVLDNHKCFKVNFTGQEEDTSNMQTTMMMMVT